MAVLEADGIDGSSLLGFLTAVGALRLLHEHEKYPSVRLWFDSETCRARFEALQAETPDQIVDAIIERWNAANREQEIALLSMRKKNSSKTNETQDPNKTKIAGKPQDIDLDELQHAARIHRSGKAKIAYFSSLMCDSPNHDADKSRTEATTLCALSGAGHQDLFVTLRDLRNLQADSVGSVKTVRTMLVQRDHLKRAIRGPWQFQDTVPNEAIWMGSRKPTLRWDEGAERLHALRYADPTQDTEPFRTELGAYALAANALACLPVVPWRRGPLTVSSIVPENGAVDFYWPLWEPALTMNAMKMLLWSAEAQRDPESAKQRGVFRLMRARRLTQEKGKLTFLPAVAVW